MVTYKVPLRDVVDLEYPWCKLSRGNAAVLSI